MDNAIELEKLADDVAGILAKREDTANSTKVLVGEVVMLVGAAYIVTKLAQNVWYRRKFKKLYNG